MSFPLKEIKERIEGKKAIYLSVIGKGHKVDAELAERIYDSELETFLSRLNEYWNSPEAHKAGDPTLTVAQGANIFLEVTQVGLSFSKMAGHVYLSRLKGTGTAVGYQRTADGEIYVAEKAGAIDHLSEAVLVLKGEQFAIKNTPDGRHVADHVITFENSGKFTFDKLMVGYVYIIYPNGDRELYWINANRLDEYRQKSSNKYLYNDESFIKTKIIKNALRKVRKTDFMQTLQAEEDEIISENRDWEEVEAPLIDDQPAAAFKPTPLPHKKPLSDVKPVAQPAPIDDEPF